MTEGYEPGRWFEHVFGFKESIQSVYDNIKVIDNNGMITLHSEANNRDILAGEFRLRNISSFEGLQEVGGGSLNIIHGKGSRASTRLVNVLEAQAVPEFDGATFLAASNFNGLEFVSGSQTAESGITGYIYDRTQGPYCAMGAAGSILYRNYCVKHETGQVGQIEKEINFLCNSPLGKFVKHGYPSINASQSKKLASHNWDDLDQFYVGCHSNCELTTTQLPSRAFADAPPGRIVHHVYAAALSYTYYVDKNDVTLKIGEALLKAQYQAHILASWENSQKYPGRAGSKRSVMTLLGGGVFGNSMEMICNAILSCQDLIVKSGLEVFVTCYDESGYNEVYGRLKGLIDKTHGRVIEADGKI